MCNKYSSFIFLVVVVAIVGFTAGAQAEVLFSDNFNGAVAPVAPDYSLNSNLSGRLGGSIAPGLVTADKAWDRSDSSAINTSPPTPERVQVNNTTYGADKLVIGSWVGPGSVFSHSTLIQHDFSTDASTLAAGGFTVRWDMDPLLLGSSSDTAKGGGVIIGAMDGTQSNLDPATTALDRLPSADSHVEYSLQLNDNGKFLGRSKAGKAGWSSSSNLCTYDTNPPANHDRWYTFELRVATTNFAQGAPASASLWWGLQGVTSENLVQADLTMDTAGDSYSWTWDADGAVYIGLFGYTNDDPASGFGDVTMFDNVSVFNSTVVPEPSTIALLATGLIGLLAYAWRKRK